MLPTFLAFAKSPWAPPFLGVVLFGGYLDTNLQLLSFLVVLFVIDAFAAAADAKLGSRPDAEWKRKQGKKLAAYLLLLPAAFAAGSSSVVVLSLFDEGVMGLALFYELSSVLRHVASIHEIGGVILSSYKHLTGRSEPARAPVEGLPVPLIPVPPSPAEPTDLATVPEPPTLPADE